LVFLVVSFLLAFPPISYTHSWYNFTKAHRETGLFRDPQTHISTKPRRVPEPIWALSLSLSGLTLEVGSSDPFAQNIAHVCTETSAIKRPLRCAELLCAAWHTLLLTSPCCARSRNEKEKEKKKEKKPTTRETGGADFTS
jgi:hypothetical protein